MIKKPALVRTILLAVFFLSGFSALVYQIIWIKMLGQVFGLTVFAVSTVLTAFMAGLALGSYIFGKIIDRQKNYLFIFFLIEGGIGVFALLFPLLFKLVSGAYVAVATGLRPDLYSGSIIRFAVSFLMLIIPTTLMGGTLPVISRYYVENLSGLGGNVGNLYSVNNLGALLGCFGASFVLIQITGLSGCMLIAAVINVLAAAVVLLIQAKAPSQVSESQEKATQKPEKKSRPRKQATYPDYVLRLVLWVFAIEGFTTLAYEVIWTRILLGISYDKSPYFFATVIMAFICGLAAGSFIAGRFADRGKNLVFALGAIEIAIGILACASLFLFASVSELFVSIRPSYSEPWMFSLGREYLVFFLLMIGPAVLMGTTFPIVAKIYTTSFEALGRKIGIIGALDTIGSIAGSFVAGFVLVPFLGVVNAVIATASLNVVLGITLVAINPRTKPVTKAALSAATVFGAALLFLLVPRGDFFEHWQTEQEDDRLLFYREGLGSTIAVPQKFDGVRELAIDGAVTAIAEYGDIRVHKLLAYLPYLFSDSPESALIVGFGMGVTAQSLLHDSMKNVTCVEINSEIISGSASYFERENKNVLSNPKLKVVIEDGRSYMATTNERYDIITTNAVHPRLSINIYTREFYELCKSNLTEGGVMCQWMATNWLSDIEYRMLVKSFTDVFRHATVWVSNIGHVLLLGTPEPLSVDIGELSRRMKAQKVSADLSEVHLADPAALLALFACGPDELGPLLRDIRPATDDFPLPEMSKYISTLPNPVISEEILSYGRNVRGIISSAPDNGALKKLDEYAQAERHFLIARHTHFITPAKSVTAELEKAVSGNPFNFHFHTTLGDSYSAIGETEKALAEFKAASSLDPRNPLGYINTASVLLTSGRYDDALAETKKSLALDPGVGLAHYLVSVIYRLKSDFRAASKGLEYVTEHFPRFTHAFYELAEVYIASGKLKEASVLLSEYVRKAPDDKDGRALLDELKRAGY